MEITVSAPTVIVPLNVPTASLMVGAVTLLPGLVTTALIVPFVNISGGGGDQFSQYGNIEWTVNTNDYVPTMTFFFRAVLKTTNASVPIKARLFNISDGQVVAGSEISSTSTASTEIISGAL